MHTETIYLTSNNPYYMNRLNEKVLNELQYYFNKEVVDYHYYGITIQTENNIASLAMNGGIYSNYEFAFPVEVIISDNGDYDIDSHPRITNRAYKIQKGYYK